MSHSHSYSVQILRQPDEFDAVKAEWQLFLQQVNETHLCWAHAFLKLWLTHFRPLELLILLIRNTDGQLVGLLPLQIQKLSRGLFQRGLKRLQFLGSEPSLYDQLGLLTLAGENREAIIQAVCEILMREKTHWDILDLQFCAQQDLLEQLNKFFKTQGATCYLNSTEGIPIVALDLDTPKTKQKSIRLNLKRIKKRMLKEDPETVLKLEFLSGLEQTESLLEAFIQKHISYWQTQNFGSDFARYPGLSNFYKALSQHFSNQVLFCRLLWGDQTFSEHILFVHQNFYSLHLCLYEQEFQKYYPGLLHLEAVIDHLSAANIPVFEMGRGEQAYKLHWTENITPLFNLTVIISPWARFLWQADIRLKKLLRR